MKKIITTVALALIGYGAMAQEIKETDFKEVEDFDLVEEKKMNLNNTTNVVPQKYFCCSPYYNLPSFPTINVSPASAVEEGEPITVSTPAIANVSYQWLIVVQPSGQTFNSTTPSFTIPSGATIGQTHVNIYLKVKCGEKVIQSKKGIKIKPNPCKCEKNIVRNSGFYENLNVAGGSSMPTASTNDWTKATHSPQLYADAGGCDKAYVSMWGNKVETESVVQKVALQSGKYIVKFQAKNAGNATRAPFVRFKVRAANSLPGTSGTPQTITGGFDLATTSNISSTSWASFSYIVTIPQNYSYVFVYPEFDSTDKDGGHTKEFGAGMFDNLCITKIQ